MRTTDADATTATNILCITNMTTADGVNSSVPFGTHLPCRSIFGFPSKANICHAVPSILSPTSRQHRTFLGRFPIKPSMRSHCTSSSLRPLRRRHSSVDLQKSLQGSDTRPLCS